MTYRRDRELQRYLRYGHRRVEGWLVPGAMKMIVALADKQRTIGITGNVCEIGVHHGRLFILLHLLTQGTEKSIAIDIFEDQDKNIDKSGEGSSEKLIANIQRFSKLNRIAIHKADSTELDTQKFLHLIGGRPRLISIDGGHTPEITAHDLSIADGALSDGGIIILDDCFNELWPGVSEGVHRYSRQPHNIVPFATGGNKTFFCRKPFANRYKASLDGLTPKSGEHRFLSSTVLCCSFAPLPVTERIGQLRAWRAIKDVPPLPLVRSYWVAWVHRNSREE